MPGGLVPFVDFLTQFPMHTIGILTAHSKTIGFLNIQFLV